LHSTGLKPDQEPGTHHNCNPSVLLPPKSPAKKGAVRWGRSARWPPAGARSRGPEGPVHLVLNICPWYSGHTLQWPCSTVAVHYSGCAVQWPCSTVTVQCSAMQHLHCTMALHCIAVQRIAVQCSSVHRSSPTVVLTAAVLQAAVLPLSSQPCRHLPAPPPVSPPAAGPRWRRGQTAAPGIRDLVRQ
jgi:hypothetical protein